MQGANEQDIETGSPDPRQTSTQGHSVRQRWLTALVAIPVVLIFVWFGGWVAFAAAFLVVILGTLELHTMLRHGGYHPLIWISLGLSVLFLVAAMLPQWRLSILEIGLGGSLLVSFPWLFFRQKLDGAMIDWALTLAISVYLGWSMSFFLLLRGSEPGMLLAPGRAWIVLPRGAWWLLVVLLGVWGFDSAAFFSGRYWGRHKMAPAISPAKTWEGAFGGFILSIAAGLLLTVNPLGVPWYLAIVLGVLIGIAAVLGDLAESLIKRQTHVKDSGQLMPGHGGMLDRIDSLLFAVIVVYLFAQLVGK
ncbi:MAG TPA: phosphatidate cytidylyltransferase [Ktedonobacteraceae bacterium]|nr:phosphatidate cytidylyltransferase [Ktedonobacteraceae bacterium]